MSDDSDPTDDGAPSSRRRMLWPVIGAAGMGALLVAIWQSPPNTFHPTCTYTVNARVSADVEIRGERLSSSVVYQNSRSRRWLAMINSAGCDQWYGDVLTYRLADDSVLIVPTQICRKGEQELEASGRLDILATCTGRQAHQDAAFIIDSASRPSRWHAATIGLDFRITRMVAESTWDSPSDDMATIAPNLLKSDFKYERQQWSRSPERLISFHRRYQERRDRPEQSYEFQVINQRFK